MLEYMLDFPQVPVQRECYINIPKGVELNIDTELVIKVKRNIHGKIQAGRAWNKFPEW